MAYALTPRTLVADLGPRVNLDSMIPKRIGAWTFDENFAPLRTDPETAAKLDSLYSQLLSRTYVNAQGQRVLLLIAYGGNQSDSMQAHKPEVCYPSLGFELLKQSEGSLETGFGPIPVRRLVAVMGPRVEPVTYWITIGDRVATGASIWKLEQIKYGLTGKIPDGLLFRLSSFRTDDASAYRLHEAFTQDLLKALPGEGSRTVHRACRPLTAGCWQAPPC